MVGTWTLDLVKLVYHIQGNSANKDSWILKTNVAKTQLGLTLLIDSSQTIGATEFLKQRGKIKYVSNHGLHLKFDLSTHVSDHANLI